MRLAAGRINASITHQAFASERHRPVQEIERDLSDPMAERGMPETDEMSDFRGKPSAGAGL
jgi:hypothetical protein